MGAEGFTGNLCAGCSPSFGRKGAVDCTPCWKNKTMIKVMIGVGALAIVAIFAYLIRSTIKANGEPKKLNVAIAKIALNHFQLSLIHI